MIETYTFTHATAVYTYTSADDAISRGPIVSTLNSTGVTLQFDVPRTHQVALLFRHFPPDEPISIRVTVGIVQVWSGFVTGARWHGSGATLECADALAASQKLAPSQRFNRNCRHVLHSPDCGVPREYLMQAGTVVGEINHSNRTVTVRFSSFQFSATSILGGVLKRGKYHYQVTGYEVISSSPVEVKLLLMNIDDKLETGDSVNFTPGCDHTAITCASVFDNIARFGGLILNEGNPFEDIAK